MANSNITTVALLTLSAGLLVRSAPLSAQGCEPIRFTTPVDLGGEGEAYKASTRWQFGLSYRRLVSNEFFVGTSQHPELGPGGQSPEFKIHTLVTNLDYAITDRWRLSLSVPVSRGTVSRKWPDGKVHDQNATGIGDVSLTGDAWLLTPRTHRSGNIGFGLGIKAPTGSNTIKDRFYTAKDNVEFPADQTIQPGDGGWAVLLQTHAFRRITERSYAYGSGSYMMSPRARSDVKFTPTSAQYWSVPDVYSARLGGSFNLLPDQGLTVSLGGRMDGIPVHDLIGGGDDSTIKRTAYIMYAEPGLSLSVGRERFSLSVPYRLKVNREKSLFEAQTNGVNGGGFAKYLVFVGFTHRL
jgi:hypothetical protein